jgi:hypothetical protein
VKKRKKKTYIVHHQRLQQLLLFDQVRKKARKLTKTAPGNERTREKERTNFFGQCRRRAFAKSLCDFWQLLFLLSFFLLFFFSLGLPQS